MDLHEMILLLFVISYKTDVSNLNNNTTKQFVCSL